MHQNSFVYGVANSLWTKGALFLQVPEQDCLCSVSSSINNSSGQRSCPKLRPNYMLMKILQMWLLFIRSPLLPAHRQKGQKPFRSLRNLKTDLDLTVEGDLNIVMAFAEKLRGGLHSFVFGKPFYTSVQERDALMSFWPQLHPLTDTDVRLCCSCVTWLHARVRMLNVCLMLD